MVRRFYFLTVVFILGHARAEDASYEGRLIQWGLSLHGRTLEPQPHNLPIEEILFATENVFSPSDPYPLWFNAVHLRTREHVIARELLVAPGQSFDETLVKESERNLRRLYILAIVRIVAVKGRNGGIALLVITKDRWSLRLNSDFNWVGPLLQYLRLQPTEQNLLGYNQQLSFDYQQRLDTVSLGQVYQAPRFSRYSLLAGQTASIVLNRQTLQPEGYSAAVAFGRPLRNLGDTWALSLTADARERIRRIFRGASVWSLSYPDDTRPTGQVPYLYNEQVMNWEGGATRSFGKEWKLDISGGVGGFARRYTVPNSSGLTEDEASWFLRNYVPRTEAASFLFLSARLFQAQFRVLRDMDTFELSEDFQLGPSVFLVGRWAHPWLLSPQHFTEVGASARYRWLWNENLLTVSAAGATRFWVQESRWVNQRLAFEVLNMSPKWAGGRLVTRAYAELRRDDLDNRQLLLGGGNGLRGAVAESLSGPNAVLANVEYRTRSWEVKTFYIGGVFFYDTGSAFRGTPSLTHTVGAGLRILAPQWNQETIRIDFGWVLNANSALSIDRFSGSYGQVTDYRSSLFSSPLN